MILTIDLNSDLGEGFGTFESINDKGIMKYISSANIACGFHAGDHQTMHETVLEAKRNQVSIGAHPGLNDLYGFGRRMIPVSPREVYDLMIYQLGAINAFAIINDTTINHVKPHGALYNMANVNRELADAIAEAIYDFNPQLVLYGLSGGELVKSGEKLNLRTANEVFADRTYQSDGTLTNRLEKNAMIKDPDIVVERVMMMIKDGTVKTVQGDVINMAVDTICVHGDEYESLMLVKYIYVSLLEHGIQIRKVEKVIE